MQRDLSDFEHYKQQEITYYTRLLHVIEVFHSEGYRAACDVAQQYNIFNFKMRDRVHLESKYRSSLQFLESLTEQDMRNRMKRYEDATVHMDEALGDPFQPLRSFIRTFIPKESEKKRKAMQHQLKTQEQEKKTKLEVVMRFEDEDVPQASYSFYG